MSSAESGDPPPPDWTLLRDWVDNESRPSGWRRAGIWALDVLERELGPRWPERTWINFGAVPGMLVMAGAYVFAYLEMLELALKLTLIRDADGYQRLVKNLKRNPVPAELAHLRVQLEVAGFARRAEYGLVLEPALKQGTRTDLILRGMAEEFAVETAVMLRSDEAVSSAYWMDRINYSLMDISSKHDVGFTASFARELSEDETEELMATVSAAASFVARGGAIPAIETLNVTIEVHPDNSVYKITGPRHEVDSGAKLESLLADKAVQTRGPLPTWICIHSLEGLFLIREWNAASASAKLSALAERIQPTLENEPHVAGVVISNGAAYYDIRQDGDEAESPDGTAIRQPIPPFKHREVFVVNSPHARSAHLFWAHAYRSEPTWLSWALDLVGLPGISEIFVTAG
jgi:hypothetical protein